MGAFLLPILSTVSGALRIPAIAMFLGNLAAQVLGWFVQRMSRRLAVNLTILTMVAGLTVTTSAALYGIVNGLSFVIPSYLSEGISLFVPDNAIPCVAAIGSARIIRWVWEWQFFTIMKVSS
ncbi:DUF5455 family protein [Vibrio sp. AK197]|uniref:DUF5455 family protein n=1 Tax=Vibrio olivae TaxID=1243002 RepID=A0ABV5HRE0_9VIBR